MSIVLGLGWVSIESEWWFELCIPGVGTRALKRRDWEVSSEGVGGTV